MSTQPVVLFYGNPACPATEQLYQAVRAGERCRALYLEQALFPREAPFLLTVGEGLTGDYVEVWGEALPLEAIRSVCVNGFAVPADRFPDLNEADTVYAQTESWATLHALLASWQQHTLVVNRPAHRDALASRFSELWLLSGAGLTVPDLLVTSDPATARAFDADHPKGVLYKSVYGLAPLRPLDDAGRVRLDSLAECPIHLEAALTGQFSRLVWVGGEVRGDGPEDVRQKFVKLARDLDLHLAELHLLRDVDEWRAVRLIPFVSAEALLADPQLLDLSVGMLEGGRS